MFFFSMDEMSFNAPQVSAVVNQDLLNRILLNNLNSDEDEEDADQPAEMEDEEETARKEMEENAKKMNASLHLSIPLGLTCSDLRRVLRRTASDTSPWRL